MDWTNGLLGFMTNPSLNGSTAPNSSAIPVSTPVNTSGNPNGSGSSFGSFFQGLASLGTTAANAYQAVTGRPAPKPVTTALGAVTPTTSSTPAWKKYLPWAIAGAVVLVIGGWLLFRSKKP